MSQYNEFAGVYSLLLTPFNWDRTIDYKCYEEYVAWQAAFKPQHLFAVCGSSEMTELTLEERIKCAGLAVKNSDGVPVFATANLEKEFNAQVEEMKMLEQQGVSGLVFVTKGMCDKPDHMYEYMTDLASHTELPIILYEFPGLRPHLMDSVTYGKLAKTGKFKGIKDTTCKMPEIEAKIAVQGDSNVLQANIPFLYDAYLKGARGVIISIAASAEVGLEDVDFAANAIRNECNEDANIIFGVAFDPSLEDEMRITIIAAGFNSDESAKEDKKESAPAGDDFFAGIF